MIISMEFSLLSILLIKNFIQGIILLTLFLINFLFIRLIVPVLTAKNITTNVLTRLSSTYCQILIQLSLSLMLVLRTMSLLPSLMFTPSIVSWRRLFIMLSMSCLQKLNYLLSDIVSIKLFKYLLYLASLLLQMFFMQQKEYLILPFIHTKSNWLQ